jgi:hypothetical protein
MTFVTVLDHIAFIHLAFAVVAIFLRVCVGNSKQKLSSRMDSILDNVFYWGIVGAIFFGWVLQFLYDLYSKI